MIYTGRYGLNMLVKDAAGQTTDMLGDAYTITVNVRAAQLQWAAIAVKLGRVITASLLKAGDTHQ